MMTRDATQIARSLLNDAQQLMREISEGMIDVVVSNAAQIRSFNSLREELTTFEAQYLYFYAFGLVLFSRTIRETWANQDIESVLEAAADELSRKIAYSRGSEADLKQIRASVFHNARNMYENTKSSYGRLLSGEVGAEAVFTLVMRDLTHAFPGASILLTEAPELLTIIVQRFGTLSLAGAVGASAARPST